MKDVLSGKYASETDPEPRLAGLVRNLEELATRSGTSTFGGQLAELNARLAEAKRQGDHALARDLSNQIIATRTAATRKQAD